MKNWYFVLGQFSASGCGWTYYAQGTHFCIVCADTYNEAYQIVLDYGTSLFGERKYEDVWYGVKLWNWEAKPHTEYTFKRTYKDIEISLKSKDTNFNEHYPIVELAKDYVKEFSGTINDIK